MTDLEIAFNEIRNKRGDLDTLFNYANGPQPLKYSTQKLAEGFGDVNTHFEVNWCSVIVDSALDRIQLSGFMVEDKAATEKIKVLFDKLHLDIEADKAHGAALSTSQAYLIVWKDSNGEFEAYYNDPRLCAVFHDPAKPQNKTFAAKWFEHPDKRQEITLYYTDRIEHWISKKEQTGTALDKASAFQLESRETNPYRVIPVFELKTQGEIFKVLTIQDAINKLFADMMMSSEFSTFPQRYIISQSDPGSLKNNPSEIWWLPAGDGQGQQASAGQFQASTLGNFSTEMDNLANRMFVITRTPKHYLMTTGANISGEALLAMEAPLVKKCKKRQREFGSQWQDIAAFLLQLDGVTIDPSAITPIWERIESAQPKTEAETRQIAYNTGIPLITLLKREGWSEKEITAMAKDKQLQQKAEKTVAQAVLNDLRIKQQQDQEEDVNA